MRKNLNKIISLAIGISVVSGSIIPAFAVDITDNTSSNVQTQVNQNTVLTLDDVVKAAISNSDKLSLKSQEIAMYRRKMDIAEYNKDYNEEIGQNTGENKIDDFPYDKLEIQENQTKQSENFLYDQIANDITNKYNSIILKQMDINKLKYDLEVKTKELGILKTKVTLGLATSNQLYDKQIEITRAQDSIKAKEDSLKVNMDYLSVLTNLNLSNYTLDSNINYSPLKIDSSIDEYLDDKISEYLKYNDEIIKRTDDYLKELKDKKMDDIKKIIDGNVAESPKQSDYTKKDENGATVNDTVAYSVALLQYEQTQEKIINAYSSYVDARYNIDEAKVKLDDSKKSLKNTLKEMYATLTDLENQINSLKEQIQSTNTKLKYAKTQVDMGIMTENDYKAQIVKSEELDISLKNLINTYNNMKNSIEKPWVLSSN